MNSKNSNDHQNFDVLCDEPKECQMSSNYSSDLNQHLQESCRKRPPGGNSMYSSTGASDITSTTSSLSSYSTSHQCIDDTNTPFIMNGTLSNHCKINSTTNKIGTHKRKLKDDSISAKQLEKPLERSDVISDSNERKLLGWHQIPTHLRFNRFILSHYREPTGWKGCIKSLGYIHNETINILTHGKTTSLYFK